MDQQETKKEEMNIKVSKNMIIGILSVLVVVLIVALCISSYGGWYGGRHGYGGYRMGPNMMYGYQGGDWRYMQPVPPVGVDVPTPNTQVAPKAQ